MAARGTPSERLILPGVLILLCLAATIWVLSREAGIAEDRVRREDLALEGLLSVATAQAAYREAQGSYGWLEELGEAQLLAGRALERDAGGAWMPTPGYRLDLLLPQSVVPGEFLRMGRSAEGGADPKLRARHYALVARPLDDQPPAFRTWYLDETGSIWVSDSVSNVPARDRNPLPRLHLSHGLPAEVAGLLWRRIRAPTSSR